MFIWKRDLSLLKKRRKQGVVYLNSNTTHFDYDFYGFNIGKYVFGLMIKTGESKND